MQTRENARAWGPVQVGIVLAALGTALIHWYLVGSLLREGRSPVLFVLNGLGYVALLVALFLPQALVRGVLPAGLARRFRPAVRYLMIGYTLLTITLWYVLGPMITPIAIADKLIEAALVVLLWLDRARDSSPASA